MNRRKRRKQSEEDKRNKKIGAAGFEPATSWSQTKRDTRLRYAPKKRCGPDFRPLWPSAKGGLSASGRRMSSL